MITVQQKYAVRVIGDHRVKGEKSKMKDRTFIIPAPDVDTAYNWGVKQAAVFQLKNAVVTVKSQEVSETK
jgi:hypothetical protein